ncbi:hypothetical protein O181_074483 [Austropuccinia psidii MF-1]|uniref:Uncharacterized protein n=1 Tax=Austropuccinia psidii MF-1 TaxID=1389203 RepID=A0A9Q3F706_9BASI|nr:hypothetical protein [Austropuccinia psidii MF-1]
MSGTMDHKRILKKCGDELEHDMRRIFIETCSKEYYINSTEEITTRKKNCKNQYKHSIENKNNGKPISKYKYNKPQDRAPLKFHKCGSKSHLVNTFPKKTRITDIELEKIQEINSKNDVTIHESDSQPSEEK